MSGFEGLSDAEISYQGTNLEVHELALGSKQPKDTFGWDMAALIATGVLANCSALVLDALWPQTIRHMAELVRYSSENLRTLVLWFRDTEHHIGWYQTDMILDNSEWASSLCYTLRPR